MAAPRTLGGILAPVTTPFDARTGAVDGAAFESNLRAHLQAGLAGVVVAGSNGEAPLLDEAERLLLVERARTIVPHDRWLLAGTGAESTRASVRLAREAALRGADAALVVGPHYYGAAILSAMALAAHFQRIADESPIPVVLYNIPKYMHYSLAPQLVNELAAHGNVRGIKDSSGDLSLLSTYLNAQSDRFAVLIGNAQLLAEGVRAGIDGGIVAVSMFAPALTLELFDAARRGDASAAALQERLAPLGREIVGTLSVPGVKAALDIVGLAGGQPRPPLLPLSHEATTLVRTMLHEAGVIAA
ncbi:MAG: dihydrodipicolinate synthase family protein [Gemmatimonadaceae bacterium]|nr:dihydrodipicolinate synthase family protein [Gemmatimonadaceae bacterium]